MLKAYSGFSEMSDSLDLGIPLGLGNSGSDLRPWLAPDFEISWSLGFSDDSHSSPPIGFPNAQSIFWIF